MPERGEKEKNGIMNKYLTKSRTILFTFAYAYTANKIASNNDSHIQIHARDSHRGTRKIKNSSNSTQKMRIKNRHTSKHKMCTFHIWVCVCVRAIIGNKIKL